MAKRPSFPILHNPPIVEATFQVNFAVKTPMRAEEAKEFVKRKFPGYFFKGTLFTESISVKKKAPIAPPAEIIHEQNRMGWWLRRLPQRPPMNRWLHDYGVQTNPSGGTHDLCTRAAESVIDVAFTSFMLEDEKSIHK